MGAGTRGKTRSKVYANLAHIGRKLRAKMVQLPPLPGSGLCFFPLSGEGWLSCPGAHTNLSEKKNPRQYSFLPLRASFVSNYVSKTKHFTTNKLIYLIIRNTEEISPKAIMITSAKELCRFSKLRIKLPCLRRKFKWEVNFSWLSFCVFFGPLQTAYCTNSI